MLESVLLYGTETWTTRREIILAVEMHFGEGRQEYEGTGADSEGGQGARAPPVRSYCNYYV